jgi:hypothetical protein
VPVVEENILRLDDVPRLLNELVEVLLRDQLIDQVQRGRLVLLLRLG